MFHFIPQNKFKKYFKKLLTIRNITCIIYSRGEGSDRKTNTQNLKGGGLENNRRLKTSLSNRQSQIPRKENPDTSTQRRYTERNSGSNSKGSGAEISPYLPL
jgi:hypothetical protein